MLPLLFANQPKHHHALLRGAERFLDENEAAVALIQAHTAAEVLFEEVMSAAFELRGMNDVGAAVMDALSGGHFTRERVRKIYVALTGDEIQKQPFWSRLNDSWTLRNRVVHRGERVSNEQAAEGCKVVRELFEHLDGVIRKIKEAAASRGQS